MADSPSSWSDALVGKVLAGRYRVTEVLGAGGVGAVFAAVHLAVGRRVALKALHPEMLTHGSIVERFHREARAAAACAREGVVDVLDLDQDPACGPFLVMEHLEGETLSARLRARAPLPAGEALHIAHALLHTLAAVHAKGIVHRDLKPANVMLARSAEGREVVKILDFGLARELTSASGPALTLPGTVLGTPRYMAPEQAAGDPTVDARADVYAVGAILYCCIGAMPPYAEVAPEEALHAVLLRSPMPLDRLRPELPASLVAVVTRAMARNREERYPDAESLRAALQTAMPGFDASTTVSTEAVPLPAPVPVELAPVAPPPLAIPQTDPSAVTASARTPLHASRPSSPQIASRTDTPIVQRPEAPSAPARSRSLGRIVIAGAVAFVLLGLVLIALLLPRLWRSTARTSAHADSSPTSAPPLPSPPAAAPVDSPPSSPTLPAPLAPPPVTRRSPAIPDGDGLDTNPATGELHCRSGVHALEGIVLDLPLRIVLFVTDDCHLTCTSCTLVGTEPVVLVSGNGRLTLDRSTVTARNGGALFVGDSAGATLVDTRVTGRLPADINGTLTTLRSVYSSGVERGRGASVIDQGGNTGLR